MEFTFTFIKLFFYGLGLASPLLISLMIFIIIIGQIVRAREKWTRLDALYWSFITATTVGYGDFRPVAPLSKFLSVLIAFTGIIFTGIFVALALNAATNALEGSVDKAEVKEHIKQLQ